MPYSTAGFASVSDLLSQQAIELPSRAVGTSGIRFKVSGERIGRFAPAVAAEIGATVDVVAVGSHDTASAVVGAPPERTTQRLRLQWNLVPSTCRVGRAAEAAPSTTRTTSVRAVSHRFTRSQEPCR